MSLRSFGLTSDVTILHKALGAAWCWDSHALEAGFKYEC